MQLDLFQRTKKFRKKKKGRQPYTLRKVGYLKKDVPKITLAGKWLTKAGVHIGDTVEVIYKKDRLIIKFKKR